MNAHGPFTTCVTRAGAGETHEAGKILEVGGSVAFPTHEDTSPEILFSLSRMQIWGTDRIVP